MLILKSKIEDEDEDEDELNFSALKIFSEKI